MLRHLIITTLVIASIAFNTPAHAEAAVATLSGNEVRALDSVYQGRLAARTSQELGSTVIRIQESRDAIFLSVATPGEKQTVVKVDKGSYHVSEDVPESINSSSGVVLSGYEAKAISLAYGAWLSNPSTAPASRSDLLSGGFTVKERPILQNPSGKPGYYVTHLRAHTREPAGGLGCKDFTNYRVDPTSWKVFKQPKIC